MRGLRQTNGEIGSSFQVAKRMARRYGRIGLQEPDDIAQNAMLKLLNRKDDRQPTMGWLYKTVRSAAMDAGRQAARDARYLWRPGDDDSLSSLWERADENGWVHMNGKYVIREEHIDMDLMPRLQNMLAMLTMPLRQVLVLYSEGYSYQEIAAVTKANIGTVRSRLHYARKRAKDLLDDLA